jgi:hypothetical protein
MRSKLYANLLKPQVLKMACLLFVFTFFYSRSHAQCNLVAVDGDANIVSTAVIACDFPVYVNTGNSEADREDFAAQELNYVTNHAPDRRAFAEAMVNAGSYYIEIHQADFDAMPEGRKNAIQQDPTKYHIVE